MAKWSKWIFGGLGWAMGGPIGGIIGFAVGSMVDTVSTQSVSIQGTQPGDFGAALLVLCAAVMKADKQVLKSELDFIKGFFVKQFGAENAQQHILLLREILKQDYSLPEVCEQIRFNVDYPARLQLLHMLFGLSLADGELHPMEIQTLATISGYLGIEQRDFDSILAMFSGKNISSAYKVLEIEQAATNEEVKKAYRRLAVMHHPDKVHHLGPDFQKAAQEKFKSINDAYDRIKKERGII